MNASRSLREMKDFLPKFSIYISAVLEIPYTLSFHVFCTLKFERRFELCMLMYQLRHTLTNAQWAILEEHVLQFSL